MSQQRPFISKAENYPSNRQEGAEVRAFPALLTGPEEFEPAVIVRSGTRVRFVIPAADAIRLATEIADAVESLEVRAA